ncbi:MAG: hypothetical protein JST23_01830 [Bacteroidetes bacterium]|nr:hypothetical protein [Bacteroidota bacterium]
MKLIQQLISGILTVTVFTFSECKKNDIIPQLPAETQSGANTFGCKINGVIYTPRGSGNCYKFLIQYYKSDSLLAINTNNGCISGLSIFLKGVYETKDYTIFAPVFNSFYYSTNETICNKFDRTNSLQTGTITITRFDLPNKIVSGRFNGVLKQSGCPDVNITEGRFDFIMDVYN